MAEIVPSVKYPMLEDMDGINRIVNEEKDKTSNSGILLQKERRKRAGGKWRCRKLGFVIFRERERECLLSKIPGDRTVGFLLSKKESCSMRRGLRVGTGFKEFRKTP